MDGLQIIILRIDTVNLSVEYIVCAIDTSGLSIIWCEAIPLRIDTWYPEVRVMDDCFSHHHVKNDFPNFGRDDFCDVGLLEPNIPILVTLPTDPFPMQQIQKISDIFLMRLLKYFWTEVFWDIESYWFCFV